jgi:hypothetical protein
MTTVDRQGWIGRRRRGHEGLVVKQQRIRRIGEHAPDNGEADGKATPFFS